MAALARMLAVLMLSCGSVFALTPMEAPMTAEQQARYRTLIHELRCLVCQNQTIADSNADLARDLRAQVHARILAGESDSQIREYVTDRYGDFVLYKPPLNARTLALWIGPFLLALVAVFGVVRMLRRSQPEAGSAEPAPDRERLKQLLDEER